MIEKLKFSYIQQSLQLLSVLEENSDSLFESHQKMDLSEGENIFFDSQLSQTLHTIKGGAAILEFETIRLFSLQAEKYAQNPKQVQKAFLMLPHIQKLLRSEAQKLEQYKSPIINYTTDDIKQIFEDLAKKLGKRVMVEVLDPHHLMRTLSDDFVFKVIFPVLLNAIDHGVERPEERLQAGKYFLAQVRLEITSRDGKAALLFSDDGRGKPPIKEPGPAFGRPTLSGSGLGLEIVHGAVNDLKGSVRFDAVMGSGTFVLIEIPQERLTSTSIVNAA